MRTVKPLHKSVLLLLAASLLGSGCTRSSPPETSAAPQSLAEVAVPQESAPASAAALPTEARSDPSDNPVRRGPTLSIRATPCDLAPAGTAVLEATLTPESSDPQSAEPGWQEPLKWEWEAPPGWKLKGSGPTVEVTAPKAFDAEVEVLLTVSDAAGWSMTGRSRLRMLPQGAGAAAGRLLGAISSSPNPVAPGKSTLIRIDPPPADAVELAWQVPEGWTFEPVAGGKQARFTAPAHGPSEGTVSLTARKGDQQETVQIPLRAE
jgi:hypothetical protein